MLQAQSQNRIRKSIAYTSGTKFKKQDALAGRYDKALLFNGKTVHHYAATNDKEYFADGTEAYFYRNDFYPFVAAELKTHDPDLYNLMTKPEAR